MDKIEEDKIRQLEEIAKGNLRHCIITKHIEDCCDYMIAVYQEITKENNILKQCIKQKDTLIGNKDFQIKQLKEKNLNDRSYKQQIKDLKSRINFLNEIQYGGACHGKCDNK